VAIWEDPGKLPVFVPPCVTLTGPMNTPRVFLLMTAILVAAFSTELPAQWVHYPTPGLKRTRDGKPDLTAPVPRTPNGTPDLSGVWVSVSPQKAVAPNFAGAPGSAGPPFMNVENFLTADSSMVMLPAAEALYREHGRLLGAGRPSERCLPHSIPDAMLIPGQPFKIAQTPGLTLILFEEFNHYRQVFTDGRPFPDDFTPSWLGSSIGRWEGDTFIVETAGFNDQTWLDDSGHPHSDVLRTIERFRRINAGSMELLITFNDSKAYARPWTIRIDLRLAADSDLIEDVCDNEQDSAHTIKNKEIR
jgi:hypothetical protein